MNWEAIGAVGEVFAAFAVLLTLIFLVIELRENRKVAQSAAVNALGDGWNKLNCVVMGDPELNALWFKGMNDPESLNAEERDRFMMVCQSYVNQFMAVKKHYEAGHLPQEEWQYHSMGIAHLMNSPGGKAAAEIIAITPSVRAIFDEYRSTKQKDGFLGISEERQASDVDP